MKLTCRGVGYDYNPLKVDCVPQTPEYPFQYRGLKFRHCQTQASSVKQPHLMVNYRGARALS